MFSSRRTPAVVNGGGEGTDGYAEARRRLLAQIEREAAETAGWTGRSRVDPKVMGAMAQVPRHDFMRTGDADTAYENRARGIGYGQTISQPFVVALMTELLDLGPHDRVLEVGTGSGYQAAVLSLLARRVYSVEVVPELAEAAAERLRRLGYANVEVRLGDGRRGWPEMAPFQAIMVTAVAERVPETLVEQLSPGGRMILPVGEVGGNQFLVLVVKSDSGEVAEKKVLPVAFVPLVHGSDGIPN